MALRVIAGEARGRRLVAPAGGARPTADRVKEALFNSLGSARVEGASVLDLYAGSGALAIEALSRGADRAVLVDDDRRAHTAITSNLDATRFAERARVVRTGVAAFVRGLVASDDCFDLVFADPPYDLPSAELGAVLAALAASGTLAAPATVAVETGRGSPPLLPDGWSVGWERRYGDTLLTVVTVRPL
jgi:16S rRNA (guanine966-N2)-methyltransferase